MGRAQSATSSCALWVLMESDPKNCDRLANKKLCSWRPFSHINKSAGALCACAMACHIKVVRNPEGLGWGSAGGGGCWGGPRRLAVGADGFIYANTPCHRHCRVIMRDVVPGESRPTYIHNCQKVVYMETILLALWLAI